MFTRAKKGDVVKILQTTHSGIFVGERGVVDTIYNDPKTKEPGYAIVFTKCWPQIDINAKPPVGTRVLWFPVDAVEVIPPAPKIKPPRLRKK